METFLANISRIRIPILLMMMMMNNESEQDHLSDATATTTTTATAPLQLSSASPATASALQSPLSNPKKKRTKLNHSPATAKLKKQKPDPSAPKITRPCTECGKKFWSWKALFGHMRCHPERQWRGINPPSNFRNRPHPPPPGEGIQSVSVSRCVTMREDDDHAVAACLLMLANSPCTTAFSFCHPAGGGGNESPILPSVDTLNVNSESDYNCRFECSSCRKVFATHQALGGHRASHRNVKGCFANDCINGGGDDVCVELMRDHDNHKCSICSRIFSSGQGEKAAAAAAAAGDRDQLLPLSTSSAPSSSYQQPQAAAERGGGCGGLDLNDSVTLESSSCLCEDCHGLLLSRHMGLDLDLRLGL